ncbi:MAG: GNVR domain-containing protein [Hyphomicrobiaceae bacterium]
MTRSLLDIIRLLLNAAWRRRYMICVPFILMIPISIAGSRYAPKTYESKMILLLQETGKDNPFLKDYVVNLEVKDRFSALQALLKSEHVLLNVLKDIHGPEIAADQKKAALMMRQLASEISVTLVGGDLIELKLKSGRREGLGKMLSAISVHFLDRLLSPERSTLGLTEDFLRAQKERRRKALETAEAAFAEFKAENADKLPAVYATTVQSLGAMRQKFDEKSMELSAADAALKDMRRQLSSTNPIVGRLEESMIQASSELTSLRSHYTDGHSEVQAAERRLQRLQEERRVYMEGVKNIDQFEIERLWNLAAGQRDANDKSSPPPLLVSQLLRLQEAQGKRAALKNEVEQFKSGIIQIQKTMTEYAPIEREQARLEKEVMAARELYDLFMKRYDSASTSHALGVFSNPERVKIIDAPQDPTIPNTPPPIIFMIAGIIAGLVLGVALAVVSEMLDQTIRTGADIYALTSVPVITRLPRLPAANLV